MPFRWIGRLLRRVADAFRWLLQRRRPAPDGSGRPPWRERWRNWLTWALGKEDVPPGRRVVGVEPPVRYEPRVRVHPVPQVAVSLQKAAASAFLRALGIPYLPGVLVEHLRQYDVSFALWSFCEEFGLDFHSLADPSSPRHAFHRSRLTRVVELLVDVELAVLYTPLSGEPVVEALRRSMAEAEALVARLTRAVVVWRHLQETTIEWPRFVRFREVAAARLEAWATQDEAALAKIYTIAAEMQALRDRFVAAEAEIRRLAPALLGSDDPDVRAIAEQMVDTAGAIIDGVQTGRLEPDEAVQELEDVITVLSDMASAAGATPSDPAAEVGRCRDLLGLDPGADQAALKRAYRRQAMRCHPDHDPSPGAKERFQELQACYELLLLRNAA